MRICLLVHQNLVRLRTGIMVLVMFCLPAVTFAESLVIPDITSQPESIPDNTPRPARSMTMDQVREQYGSPLQVMGPVGNPPITRWIYDNFVVTFESEYVIHSVTKRR